MDEIDKNCHAESRKKYRKCNGQVRNEACVPGAPHRALYDQTVQKSPHKRSEHEVIAAVAHEAFQNPRSKLRGGELQRQHGDRKDSAGYSDHRTRDDGQDRSGCLGSKRI